MLKQDKPCLRNKIAQKQNLVHTRTQENKASGGDGIPVELFQILKDDAVKVLHPISISSVAFLRVIRRTHSPRARYIGVQSKVGLRKHHYKHSKWK